MSKVLENIERLIAVGESFELRVTGYSMLPLLGYGNDTIIVRRTTPTESIEHRVAMFRERDGHIVVHRVQSIKDGIVTLKGDGNIRGTEQCPRERIIGVVERVRRGNGRVVSCTSWWWRTRERLWLWQPLIIRRYALAVMRRWLNRKDKK
ncbi:MAG: S24/S26 family peptidase [Alistipes sp.]|nr:S24/S26 family peptidase [Alistipes sp.]